MLPDNAELQMWSSEDDYTTDEDEQLRMDLLERVLKAAPLWEFYNAAIVKALDAIERHPRDGGSQRTGMLTSVAALRLCSIELTTGSKLSQTGEFALTLANLARTVTDNLARTSVSLITHMAAEAGKLDDIKESGDAEFLRTSAYLSSGDPETVQFGLMAMLAWIAQLRAMCKTEVLTTCKTEVLTTESLEEVGRMLEQVLGKDAAEQALAEIAATPPGSNGVVMIDATTSTRARQEAEAADPALSLTKLTRKVAR